MAVYHYRLSSTGYSSARYGACEVCGKAASEVFIQCELREFDLDGKIALTYHEARGHTFGHEECLKGQQRGGGGSPCRCAPGTGCSAWRGRKDDVAVANG